MRAIFSPGNIRKTVLLVLALWVLSCAVNPVTGKRELMLISEQQEIALGQESDPQIIQTYGLYPDAELEQFLTDLGNRIVQVSHRPDLKFHFRLLDTPVINAFAVPGGYVYFTRGILAYLNNEAEVAGVMGHEVGHVTARHSAKQISRQQLAMVGLGVGVVLSEDFARYAGLAQTGLGLVFLRFGRDAERQSDELGVEYSTKIGYDAREMANFFQTLKRMSGGEEQGGLPGWFSTHPDPAERVENVRRLAAEWQAKNPGKNFSANRESYLRRLDGLVFGEDPRQGYTEDNMFYHPELKFQFPVPAGWKVINTPSQVQIVSSNQQAAMLFQIAKEKTPGAAAQAFVEQSKATVVRSEAARVHGLDAHRLLSDLSTQQGVLRVLSYFIAYEGNVYLFHGYTAKTGFAKYQGNFESTMRGFNRLTDPRKINVEPRRIRIKTVRQTTTLEAALQSLGVAQDKLEGHALLNGMLLSDTVPANTLIKVVEK